MTATSTAVFLSYASQDADAARRICEALRGAGVEVWFDQSELRGGDAWDQSIRRQIRDCALFVPVISKNTDARAEGYFRREWRLAVDRTLDLADDEAFLLPVVIDDTADATARVPDKFREVQWTRLPASDVPLAFVERVSRLLSDQPPLRTAAVGGKPPVPKATAHHLRTALLVATVGAAIAVGYGVASRFTSLTRTTVGTPTAASTGRPAAAALTAVSDRSIAVLSFMDLSENRDQEYFSDGLAEELLDLLAKVRDLHVIARTSSFSFKGKDVDIATIARALHVANILQGSVRKSGKRFRVSTQLIHADTGEHLWSETYDSELKDIFRIQDEIATAVVGALKAKLLPSERLVAADRTDSLEAYNDYLRAREFLRKDPFGGQRAAIEAYQQAIARDPRYAVAYAGLAKAIVWTADSDAAALKRGADAADKAVALAPDSALAYATRAWVRLATRQPGSHADAAKALALNPADWQAVSVHAMLSTDASEALAAYRKAADLDPLFPASWLNLAATLTSVGQYAAARDAFEHLRLLDPTSDAVSYGFARLALLEGNAAAALESYRRLAGTDGSKGLAMADYSVGNVSESQRELDKMIANHGKDDPYAIATVFAWRGDTDQAFEWLERADRDDPPSLLSLSHDPFLKKLHADPRFAALVQRTSIPE